MSTDTREALADLVAAHDALQARSWPGGPAQYEQQRDELRSAWANARAALATQPAQPPAGIAAQVYGQSIVGSGSISSCGCSSMTDGFGKRTEFKCAAHATQPAQPSAQGEAVAWEGPTGFIRYITQEKYEKLSPEHQRHYKPYRCSTCASAPAAPEQAAEITRLRAEAEALRNAHFEILRVHANDNIRPKAFYIASAAIAATKEQQA